MRGEQHSWPKFWLRLPPALKAWIEGEAKRNGSSQNSEIVRSVRQRMEAEKQNGEAEALQGRPAV